METTNTLHQWMLFFPQCFRIFKGLRFYLQHINFRYFVPFDFSSFYFNLKSSFHF